MSLPMALTHHSANNVLSLGGMLTFWGDVREAKLSISPLLYLYLRHLWGNFLCPDSSDRFLRRLRLT
jgi:hypothetical protein